MPSVSLWCNEETVIVRLMLATETAVLLGPVKTGEELVPWGEKGGSRMERNDGRDGRTRVRYLKAMWLTDCEQVCLMLIALLQIPSI